MIGKEINICNADENGKKHLKKIKIKNAIINYVIGKIDENEINTNLLKLTFIY